ncbi:MAG: aminotransferase class I/II-fold pyridoxal phosphate-dependent enzyme, partial [Methanobacteriota archaeon]
MAKRSRGTPSFGFRIEDRRVADRVQHFPESVIREMTRIAAKHNAINLAQGFPDFEPPREIVEAARKALEGPHHQYAITWGAKPLRDAIAAKAKRFNGIEADPEANVVVTCGSTEAMMAAMLSVVSAGDEVVIPEPFYENYGPDAIVSGAKAVFVPMAWPSWEIDEEALKQAFTKNTKAIVLNTPNNPTGKVFSRSELKLVADLVEERDALAITDEIYEHITYGGKS